MRRSRPIVWSILGFGAAWAAAQLIPVHQSNPPVRSDFSAPRSVKQVVRRACYDCHSNETRWPWYARVAPMSWLVTYDVREARESLNFSEWPFLDLELESLYLEGIEEQIRNGDMPLKRYTLLHPNARLTRAEREMLLEWLRPMEMTLESTSPSEVEGLPD